MYQNKQFCDKCKIPEGNHSDIMSAPAALHSAQCTLHSSQFTLQFAQWTVHSSQCTVHSAAFPAVRHGASLPHGARVPHGAGILAYCSCIRPCHLKTDLGQSFLRCKFFQSFLLAYCDSGLVWHILICSHPTARQVRPAFSPPAVPVAPVRASPAQESPLSHVRGSF